jgi:hypothetical protein
MNTECTNIGWGFCSGSHGAGKYPGPCHAAVLVWLLRQSQSSNIEGMATAH